MPFSSKRKRIEDQSRGCRKKSKGDYSLSATNEIAAAEVPVVQPDAYDENSSEQQGQVFHAADMSQNGNTLRRSKRLAAKSGTVVFTVNAKAPKRFSGFSTSEEDPVSMIHDCGPMTHKCTFCGALHFESEKPRDGLFSICCHKGSVKLDSISSPSYIKFLFTKNDSECINFRSQIRQYNNAFAFASMGASLCHVGSGPYCFKIHGQIYHKTSNAIAGNGIRPQYSQLYFLDPTEALNQRSTHGNNNNCLEEVFQAIDTLIREINPFANSYQCLKDRFKDSNSPENVMMDIVTDKSHDQRRYNNPSATEVAIIFEADEDGAPPLKRDLRIYPKATQHYQQISILNPNLDPMVYPLFFINGEKGWEENMRKLTVSGNISHLQFYSYRIAVRNEFNPILYGGKLFQQYVVDVYVRIEANRLNWIKSNQSSLRAESYSGLIDHLEKRCEVQNRKLGRLVILPSTFPGSPRAMHQNYQDAMCIVAKFSKPDLFITMTCNPNWPEIRNNLFDHQVPSDRPDIVARVFKIKLQSLLDDITKHHVFGETAAYFYTIEFQKRGLPHAHILIILQKSDKITEPDRVDQLISAEIPDKNSNPRLFANVVKHMIHRPCGLGANTRSPCLDDKLNCTKKFPKPFRDTTHIGEDGFPSYRRCNDGVTAYVRSSTESRSVVDNRWVVPYNPFLLLKYDCHINVEISANIKAIKYLFKYVYKGYDCADVCIDTATDGYVHVDETKTYVNSRYVSPPEACWKIFEFPMHGRSHGVVRLQVHLPKENIVFFHEGEESLAIQRAEKSKTTLQAWFELNQTNVTARQHTYVDIPYYFTFSKGIWKERVRNSKVVSRMYSVSPKDIERFSLRLLLLHVKGATSYDFLKTFEGEVYDTFHEAAVARRLFADDSEWESCMREASFLQMPNQLRMLFGTICVFTGISNVSNLFDKFKEQMCEDFTRENISLDIAVGYAMHNINAFLITHGMSWKDLGLPPPKMYIEVEQPLGLNTDHATFTMNREQELAYTKIKAAIDSNVPECKCFYIDGPGGTGKTYLYNALITYAEENRFTSMAVASTGIAATLLRNGRTAHSAFKIPVPTFENSVSYIKPFDKDAKNLQKCKLFVWDECTMANVQMLRVVDLLLREVMQNDIPFGGKVFVLGGDFRQILPVVKYGNKGQILLSCLKSSPLWRNFKVCQLKTNMRASQDEKNFANWLLDVGNGVISNVDIPMECASDDIVKDIYNDIGQKEINKLDLTKRAILCVRNSQTHEINDAVLEKCPGEAHVYLSADSINEEENQDYSMYSTEYLNSLTPSGMPPHRLK